MGTDNVCHCERMTKNYKKRDAFDALIVKKKIEKIILCKLISRNDWRIGLIK